MATSKDLTKEDILHIAKLASLQLDETEVTKFQEQLSETISYIENLSELDTENVIPTSHSTAVTNVYFQDGKTNERQLSQEYALFNAQNKAKKNFIVKRIMHE